MPGFVHALPSPHDGDSVRLGIRTRDGDLGGSLQLNVLQLLPLPPYDVAMVLLGNLEVSMSLGGERRGQQVGR